MKETKEIVKTKKQSHKYTKTITIIFLFIIFSIGFVYSGFMSFSITNREIINYSSTGDIDYQIFLKNNDFYNSSYLPKGMAYIASLIDTINIKYNYKFDTTKDSNMDITYQVKAKLTIASQTNSNVFFEQDYDLSKEVIDEMVNKNQYIISKSINIDYNYYNDLANKFKSSYAVNADSKLEVYLLVNIKNKEDNSYQLVETNKLPLTIPLSQQEVNIKMNEATINEKKEIVFDSKYAIDNMTYFLLSCVCAFFLSVIIFHALKKLVFTMKNRYSKYDRYVNRLLRGYDRIIINVKTPPEEKDYNVIKVESFEELVDARDNTKEPINYLIVKEHQHCKFFIMNQNNMYLYEVMVDNRAKNYEKK